MSKENGDILGQKLVIVVWNTKRWWFKKKCVTDQNQNDFFIL